MCVWYSIFWFMFIVGFKLDKLTWTWHPPLLNIEPFDLRRKLFKRIIPWAPPVSNLLKFMQDVSSRLSPAHSEPPHHHHHIYSPCLSNNIFTKRLFTWEKEIENEWVTEQEKGWISGSVGAQNSLYCCHVVLKFKPKLYTKVSAWFHILNWTENTL